VTTIIEMWFRNKDWVYCNDKKHTVPLLIARKGISHVFVPTFQVDETGSPLRPEDDSSKAVPNPDMDLLQGQIKVCIDAARHYNPQECAYAYVVRQEKRPSYIGIVVSSTIYRRGTKKDFIKLTAGGKEGPKDDDS